MKRTIFSLVILASLHSLAYTTIRSFKEVPTQEIDQNTWVIFDVDNTLLRSRTMIGSPQWADHMKHQALLAGKSPEEAEGISHKMFADVQNVSQFKLALVDSSVTALLSEIRAKKAFSFALTSRGTSSLKIRTFDQLQTYDSDYVFESFYSFGLFFQKHQPRWKESAFLKSNSYRGIVFATGKSKGEILKELLNASLTRPNSILFIDDRINNLTDIESACKDIEIRCNAFHMTASDDHFSKFTERDSVTEWLNLKYLSDFGYYSFTYLHENMTMLDREKLASAILQNMTWGFGNMTKSSCSNDRSEIPNQWRYACQYQYCLEYSFKDDGYDSIPDNCIKTDPVVYSENFEINYDPNLKYYYKSDWTIF